MPKISIHYMDDVIRYTWVSGQFKTDGCNECGADFAPGQKILFQPFTEECVCSDACAKRLFSEGYEE